MATDDNLSYTFGDLTDTGLMDVTCSGLLQDSTFRHLHDSSICSCPGDSAHVPEVEISRAGDNSDKKMDEKEFKTDFTPEDIPSPSPFLSIQDSKSTTTQHNDSDLSGVPDCFKSMVPSAHMSMFSDSTYNVSQVLSRVQEKTSDTQYNYTLSDSTRFYSIAPGNLDSLYDQDAEEPKSVELIVNNQTEKENGHDSSFNSMGDGEIEIEEDQVSFKRSIVLSRNQRNEFLLSNGDLNAETFREQALAFEAHVLERENIIQNLKEALSQALNSNEEKDREIETLNCQFLEHQKLLDKDDKKCASPVPDTYNSESEPLNSQIEDLKLQVSDLEKKLEAEKRYLKNQTDEREMERDDNQKTICSLTSKIKDTVKDKNWLEILVANQKNEMEDLELRLKESTDAQAEAAMKVERNEDELKSAVEKIEELREVIVELEHQIDSASENVKELKHQNQIYHENLDRLEREQLERDEQEIPHDDTVVTADTDLTEELHAQVEDLARRLERKLNDMDNYQWNTRPNSSCSNAVSVSNEDISVSRDLCYVNPDCVPHDVVTLIADGLRKLDGQFESLVRFEEIIMKKLRDSEIRLMNNKKLHEELECDKQMLQEKVTSQAMKIADLENRLDQFRFEPSPNAVTLGGLRARVTALQSEVEECKGELHLKEIERQDLQLKLREKEALFNKLSLTSQQPYPIPTPVQKNSASSQTQQPACTNTSTQVKEEPFKAPKKTAVACVQTQFTWSANQDLEISTIQGVMPVTHSTPNDAHIIATSSLRNKKKKYEESDQLQVISRFSGRDCSPEVFRDPAKVLVNQSLMSDKVFRVPDVKRLDPEVSRKYDQGMGSESVYRQGEPQFDSLRNTEDGGESGSGPQVRNLLGDSPSSVHDVSMLETNPRFRPDEVQGGPSGYDADDSYNLETDPEGLAAGRSAGGPGEGSQDGVDGGKISKNSQTPPLALATLVAALDEDEKKRLYEELGKAENIGGILKEKEGEIQHLLDRIKELENACNSDGYTAAAGVGGGRNDGLEDSSGIRESGGLEESGERTSAGEGSDGTVVRRGKSHTGSGSAGGANAGSCVIETTLDFDEAMKPVNAETRMNYVVTAGGANNDRSRSTSGALNLSAEVLKQAKDVYDQVGCDLSVMCRLTEMQAGVMLHVLTALVQTMDELGSEATVAALNYIEESYTYELETVCDFQVGDNGDLTLVNAQGRVIPSESRAKVSAGARPMASRSRGASGVGAVEMSVQNTTQAGDTATQSITETRVDTSGGSDLPEPPSTSGVDWNRLEKEKDLRIQQTDAVVELNVLKTNMEMLRQAYEQEKQKNRSGDVDRQQCHDLGQLLCQQRGRTEDLKYLVNQQQQEINSLNQSLQELKAHIAGMNSRGEGGGIACDQLQLENPSNPPDESNDEAGGIGNNVNVYTAQIALDDNPYVYCCDYIEDAENSLRAGAQQRNDKDFLGRQTQKWFELYLRAKSYRKALAWQKKYLAIVIQGYKDLLGVSGMALDHPDLLRKQVPLTPSSVGLCDKRKGKTRFRIAAKAVLASIRMKYMVKRWTGKIVPVVKSGSQECKKLVPYSYHSRRDSSASASTDSDNSDTAGNTQHAGVPFIAAASMVHLPEKGSTGRSTWTDTSKSISTLKKPTEIQVLSQQEIICGERIKKFPDSTSSASIRDSSEASTPQLSQYFERFQSLQNEIGSTISFKPSSISKTRTTGSVHRDIYINEAALNT